MANLLKVVIYLTPLLSLSTYVSLLSADTVLAPVVFVPGTGGSQLEVRLDKPESPHFYCYKKTDWFTLWLNLGQLAPFGINCFVDNIRLVYNTSTRTTSNPPGVYSRIPGFGNTSTVEWLSKSQLSATSYFNTIADALVKIGYERNVNIRGAPYDFRKAPNEMAPYIQKLKELIENTYKQNNNQRIVLIGHSMGNSYILYFLNRQSQAWKDRYIKSYVSLAGVWGGSAQTVKLFASGENMGLVFINPLILRSEQRTSPSNTWLLPSDSFWNSTEILLSSPYRDYTVADYKQFFDDIKYPVGWMMRQDTEKINHDVTPPGVEVHCLHGVNVKTPAQFKYSWWQWPDGQPSVVYGPGDGTVNLRSLYGCLRWRGDKAHKLYHKEFTDVDHSQILKHEDVVKYILTVVQG